MSGSKTLNIYLPEELYSEIAREADLTGSTKGSVVRERLRRAGSPPTGAMISDLFGVADDLPGDLSEAPDSTVSDYGADGHH